MAMPRKGLRRVAVDGHLLTWRLTSKRTDYLWDDPDRPCEGVLVLCRAEAPSNARLLKVRVVWSRRTAVTPEVVAMVARRALSRGWDPGSDARPPEVPEVDVDVLNTRASVVRYVMSS